MRLERLQVNPTRRRLKTTPVTHVNQDRYGNVDLLKMLHRAGGDPATTNVLGLTPLSYACVFRLSMEPSGGSPWEAKQVHRDEARRPARTHT